MCQLFDLLSFGQAAITSAVLGLRTVAPEAVMLMVRGILCLGSFLALESEIAVEISLAVLHCQCCLKFCLSGLFGDSTGDLSSRGWWLSGAYNRGCRVAQVESRVGILGCWLSIHEVYGANPGV